MRGEPTFLRSKVKLGNASLRPLRAFRSFIALHLFASSILQLQGTLGLFIHCPLWQVKSRRSFCDLSISVTLPHPHSYTPLHAIHFSRSEVNNFPYLTLTMNRNMLAMLLFSFLLFLPCMGFQPALKVHDLTVDLSDLSDVELSSNKVRITEGMHTIIQTMHKVEKLPSCQKLASQALLNTCSELDHATSLATDKGIDVMLERSKSIYATRLAICELMDANANIPPSCSPFRPIEQASKYNGFRGFIVNGRFTKPTAPRSFDDSGDLDHCSASLSSNPVWWTSYSNARQNAVLLCHSMRAELDKGKSRHNLLTEGLLLTLSIRRYG